MSDGMFYDIEVIAVYCAFLNVAPIFFFFEKRSIIFDALSVFYHGLLAQ